MKPSLHGARRALLCTAALGAVHSLSACSNPLKNSTARSEYFVLRDLSPGPSMPAATGVQPAAQASEPTGAAARVLMITAGPTPTLFDSERLVYSPDGVSRSYYQFANWSERPARRLAHLAETRLARDNTWKSVANTLAGVRGDLLLTLKLEELTHDDSVQPGTMQVACTAELLDWRQRRLLQRQRFERSATVETRNASAAAAAANRAVTLMLDDLSAWTRAAARDVPK